jgi:hypothetical protein
MLARSSLSMPPPPRERKDETSRQVPQGCATPLGLERLTTVEGAD